MNETNEWVNSYVFYEEFNRTSMKGTDFELEIIGVCMKEETLS